MLQPKKNSNGSYIWSQADKEKLRDLYYEGYNDKEIGEQLGRTDKAVCYMRSILKLPKKRQPEKVFQLKGVMSDFYPEWYKQKLKREWQEKQLTSSR